MCVRRARSVGRAGARDASSGGGGGGGGTRSLGNDDWSSRWEADGLAAGFHVAAASARRGRSG